MPIYQYRCENGHEFEELRRYTERHTARCPKCMAATSIIPSTCNHSFGWRLADSSHEHRAKDKLERNI